MSNKSGTSSQVISKPTGGGALGGIGETFAPDLHTGTGNLTIPITLPPGRSGHAPSLSLGYSSGQGNGPFGLGWALGSPGVQRKTSAGLPLYEDDADTFVLSGSEDLVPVAHDGHTVRYRPRTEGLFARIEHHRAPGDPTNDHWQVRNKDGASSLYGLPGGPSPAAVLTDPDDPSKIFAWKLARTVDSFGNRIEYDYQRDIGEDGARKWSQLYLQRIRYVDYTDEASGEERFLVSVNFEYDDSRPDPFSAYRAGFEVRTRKRCRRITVTTHAEQDLLVRSYQLIYLDERVAAGELPDTALPPNGVSLLSRIQVVGHDGARSEALPPVDFSYSRFEPEGRDFQPFGGRDLPSHSLASPDLELADLFGNGLPDLFEMNGQAHYWRNRGRGRIDARRPMNEAPAGLELSDPGVRLIDADGDGRIDLMVTSPPLAGYFPTRPGGRRDELWDQRSFRRHRVAPSFAPDDPEVRFVDLDGDGVIDALRTGSRLECFFNDPDLGWKSSRAVPRRRLEEFPDVQFSDSRVRLADLSGDGLQDILLIHDGNIEYWPNLGRGDWGRRISMRNSPRLPPGYDPRRILLGDVDGDGLADLIYVDHGRVLLFVNQGGNAWSDAIEIDGTPPVTDVDAVRLVDLLGNGIDGVLWSADARLANRDHYFFLDLTGGTKPYLMHGIDNNIGALTRVEYAPSTRFYLEDEKRRETRWRTTLPFPVHVVARSQAIDRLTGGKLTTEYSYHHGYWDGVEREFRGFARVDRRDTESFERYHLPDPDQPPFEAVDAVHFSPPVETRTWFHAGPVDDGSGNWQELDLGHEYWPGDPNVLGPDTATEELLRSLPASGRREALRALRGRVVRSEVYALDGSARQDRPFTVSESLFGLREESPPIPGAGERRRVFFAFDVAARTTDWQRGDDPRIGFAFSSDRDAYGMARTSIDIAVPRGRDPFAAGEPFVVVQQEVAHARRDDSTVYIVDREAKATTYEVLDDGSLPLMATVERIWASNLPRRLLSQALHFFDGPAFQGLPWGQIGERGALVRSEALVLTEDRLAAAWSSPDPAEPAAPAWLTPGTPPVWTPEYPQAFRDALPPLAGYHFRDSSDDGAPERGWYRAERRRFDFHDDPSGEGRGQITAERDAMGRDRLLHYDPYELLPIRVVDPVGLEINAEYDYRAFQPSGMTDANGNRGAYAFTPLGNLSSSRAMGKEGEGLGDTEADPGLRIEYDYSAFADRGEPISVREIRRVHHALDTGVDPAERDATVEIVTYSDGLGRPLQKRALAAEVAFGDPNSGGGLIPADLATLPGDSIGQTSPPGAPPRVVVSAWKTHDNKGRVVEEYEPFFDRGWQYRPPTEDQLGHRAITFFDAMGRAHRSLLPDGSEQRVIFGVPDALDDPEHFEPTPWEAYTYDA
ncbi:MAG: FG-GAP-like repeat-containing protein, partial [Holophagales bacterium]|nr:FG-GAP-like repeat-containing protein [Holophagales bacterium]